MKRFYSNSQGRHLALVAAVALGRGAVGILFAEDAPSPEPRIQASRPAPAGPTATRAIVRSSGAFVADQAASPPRALRASVAAHARSTTRAGNVPYGTEAIPVRRHPDGRVSAVLPESHRHVISVTTAADGSLVCRCSQVHEPVAAPSAPGSAADESSAPAVRAPHAPASAAKPATPATVAPAEEK